MSQQLAAVRSFRKVPIFRSLNDEEMYEIIRACRFYERATGTVLFRQGESGDSAFVVESGLIDIVIESGRGRELIAQIGAGDVVGELSLIEPGPRSATAVISETAVVYELRSQEFNLLRDSLNPAAFKVIRALSRLVCQRLRTVNERIEAHIRGEVLPPATGPARVAATTATPQVVPNTSSEHAAVPEDETPAKREDLAGFARGLFSRLFKGGGT